MLTVAAGEMRCRTKTQAMSVYIDSHIICKCGKCVNIYDMIIYVSIFIYIYIQYTCNYCMYYYGCLDEM